MPDFMDRDTLVRLLQSVGILLLAYMLFVGLRGRAEAFARWANLPRLAFTPLHLTLRYGLLVVAVGLVLGRWGFHVDTLLAVLGTVLGLIAIGFVAVWSVLSNFLCAFVLVLFKPFAVGDEIELAGDEKVKGKVIDMNLLFTTLEVGAAETILVPNNTFFQRIFRRRIGTVTVGLDYQLGRERATSSSGDAASHARPAA